MKKDEFGYIVCSPEEYEILKSVLAEHGVVLGVCQTDVKTHWDCYVRNPYKTVVNMYGDDIQKRTAQEFFGRGDGA